MNDLVTVVTPPTEFEANVLAIVLRDHGIDAHVFAVPIIGVGIPLSGGTFGVPLQVSSNDLERAKKILADNKNHSIDIDWDAMHFDHCDETQSNSNIKAFAKLLFKMFTWAVILSFLASLIASLLNFAFA